MSEASNGKLDRAILLLELATSFCALVLLVGIVGENKSEAKGFVFALPAIPSTRISDWKLSANPSPIGGLHRFWQTVVEGSIGGEIAFGLILIFANRKRASADKIQIRELELQIEELRKNNLELEEWLAPRRLSNSQLSALHDQAIVIGEHDMDIVIVGDSSETKDFAQSISIPFRIAKWKFRFWSAPTEINGRGIFLSVFAGANAETMRVASDLGAAFSFASLPCKRVIPFAPIDFPGDLIGPMPSVPPSMRIAQIRMYVGEKPNQSPTSDSPASDQ